MHSRALLWVLAAGMVVAAAVLPAGWYDALPRDANVPPPPVSGVTVLRVLLVLDALLLGLLAFNWPLGSHDVRSRPENVHGGHDDTRDVGRTTAAAALTVITLIGLALRLYHIGSDLWLDEITPITDYARMPVLQIVGSYLRSNNHLLNTLGMKLMIALAGEREWAVRLPAVLLGVATIPALYWCARLAFARWASLGAALLLAVSYHHVFFSQNARGYTGYLLFALLSSRLFVNGLRADRPRDWTLYVATVVLGAASLLNMAFVGAAHVIIGAIACIRERRRGNAVAPLARRLAGVLAIAAFLSVQLYAVALPEMYAVITHVYTEQSTGFAPLSGEFLREMIRGVSSGFGTGTLIAAIPFIACAAFGWVAFLRRSWELALALTLPGVLTGGFLVVRGLTVSPRFFLLWLPLAILSAVAAIDQVLQWAARRSDQRFTSRATALAAASLLVLASASVLSLRSYYAFPKQPYRAAVAYVETHRRPADVVVVLHTAEYGIRYYGNRMGAPVESRYRFARSAEALDSAMTTKGTGKVLLVSTFERALRLELPELYERVVRSWSVTQRFPGTIGDGDVTIRVERTGRAN
jgi:mannosyltransferase